MEDSINKLENNIKSIENDNSNNDENLIENNIEKSEEIQDDETPEIFAQEEISNCLALTIKKDYNLSVIKNITLKTLRTTWKVAVSLLTLNFFKLFL